jgi:hypothetical protein
MDGTTVLLLEYDGDYAKIRFIEGSFQQKPGDTAWLRRDNVR